MGKLQLTANTRVYLQGDLFARCFAQELLTLSSRKVRVDPTNELVNIPENFCNTVQSMEELKTSVFSNVSAPFHRPEMPL